MLTNQTCGHSATGLAYNGNSITLGGHHCTTCAAIEHLEREIRVLQTALNMRVSTEVTEYVSAILLRKLKAHFGEAPGLSEAEREALVELQRFLRTDGRV